MQVLSVAGAAFAVVLLNVGLCDARAPAARDPQAPGWLVASVGELRSPPPPPGAQAELTRVRAAAAKRTAEEVAGARWWSVGGPAYRWNELAIEALLDDFVTLPLAARHLALLHAALDDAVAAATSEQARHGRRAYPDDYAAAAQAAAEILGAMFPGRAASFAARADESTNSRVLAGVAYPSGIAAGREIGRKVATLALARAKVDDVNAKWAGEIPQGPGRWQGANPIAPLAATWRPWVLARPDELRPPPPPAYDSAQAKADLAELRAFARTPRTNHRATYWEVYGGARAHVLWNEIARTKLLEHADVYDGPAAARALATLNVAFVDAAIACWDAKYAYWYIRPSQLDAELKPLFPPPNHPSYPAAHGCLSTAAATVLAALFPRDREQLLARGKEAAEARIWAGIHYRFDIDAGQDLGRKVAERVLARANAGTSSAEPRTRQRP